jgi:hypothetical protein
MAHFAELNDNNEIVRTIVISNDDILDENGQESEERGVALAQRFTGSSARWIQVSYNGSFRRQYPKSPGYVYDPNLDVLIEPSPYPSWVLDENAYWQAPIPKPVEDDPEYRWYWDEETVAWVRDYIGPANPSEIGQVG